MPTANSTSASTTRAKATRKASTAKAKTSSASAKASTPHRTRTSARGTTQAKATHAKAARTRATHQTESAIRDAQIASRESAGVLGDYAERAVLIPVGAALTARDRVLSTVSDTLSVYTSTSKAQAQLRRFERRGVTARNRLEREVRKARVRVERELRQRRREIESTVSDGTDLANRVPELANKVQERILSLV